MLRLSAGRLRATLARPPTTATASATTTLSPSLLPTYSTTTTTTAPAANDESADDYLDEYEEEHYDDYHVPGDVYTPETEEEPSDFAPLSPLNIEGSVSAFASGHPMFAVVEVRGHQFKVTPGDVIVTEKVKEADIGDVLSLDHVLLIGSESATVVGTPQISRASVVATVVEQTKQKKIIIFKKRRRKRYRRTKGFRKHVTHLHIRDIVLREKVSA